MTTIHVTHETPQRMSWGERRPFLWAALWACVLMLIIDFMWSDARLDERLIMDGVLWLIAFLPIYTTSRSYRAQYLERLARRLTR